MEVFDEVDATPLAVVARLDDISLLGYGGIVSNLVKLSLELVDVIRQNIGLRKEVVSVWIMSLH